MLEPRTTAFQGDHTVNQRAAVVAWLQEPDTVVLFRRTLEDLQRSGYYMEQVKGLARPLAEGLQREIIAGSPYRRL